MLLICMAWSTRSTSALQKVNICFFIIFLSAYLTLYISLGLALVYGRYLQGGYGYCPRAFCDKQKVVPNGLSDKPRQNRVKVYCPKCEEMYIPTITNRLDGAYFGSSLAHVFFQVYMKNIVLPPKVHFYEPQLFGFAIAGKRGSKYFKPETSGITDVKQR